jgi:GTP-binding protein
LRHVERTRLLIHVVDVSGEEGRDPIEAFDKINEELFLFNPDLESKPQLIAANKIDQTEPDQLERFVSEMKKRGNIVFPMSAAIADGTQELVNTVAAKLSTIPRKKLVEVIEAETVYKFEDKDLFTISVQDGVYTVEGELIRSIAESTNFDDPEPLAYFQKIIRKKGVIALLLKKGIKEGDPVKMYDIEFEYIE